MVFETLDSHQNTEVISLFRTVFSASEGEQEGEQIGDLVLALAEPADNQEIVGICAIDDGVIVGAIFFTRLRFDERIHVFMLSPVAVAKAYQGTGVGQALINYGLRLMKKRSVEVIVTYGDPSYYKKVGFEPTSEDIIQAPLQLSMPQGWLAQSLLGTTVPTLEGRPTCVDPFDKPDLW